MCAVQRSLRGRRATAAKKFSETAANPVEKREFKEIEVRWLSLGEGLTWITQVQGRYVLGLLTDSDEWLRLANKWNQREMIGKPPPSISQQLLASLAAKCFRKPRKNLIAANDFLVGKWIFRSHINDECVHIENSNATVQATVRIRTSG